MRLAITRSRMGVARSGMEYYLGSHNVGYNGRSAMADEGTIGFGAHAAVAAPPLEESRLSWSRLAGYVLMIGLPVGVWFAPLQLDATPKHAIAITLFMIIAWAIEALDHGLTGIIGC